MEFFSCEISFHFNNIKCSRRKDIPNTLLKQKMKEKTIEYFKKYGYPNDENEVSPKTQKDIKALNLFRKLLDVKLLCRMDEECIKNELLL